MITSKKENQEYTGQITPYHGKVHAEILVKREGLGFDRKLGDDNSWSTVMDKSFGRTFASEPREKDWQAAHKWMNDQFELLNKYGTCIVTKPKHIWDKEMQEYYSKSTA